MNARLALLGPTTLLAILLVAPAAFAADGNVPVTLAPGEKVVSHSTSTSSDSQYALELLSAIKSVRIGADKTTITIASNGRTNPIEIDYSDALGGTKSAHAAEPGTGAKGAAGPTATGDAGAADRSTADEGGTIGLGQVAGLLVGLTILSRLIGIARQLGAGRR